MRIVDAATVRSLVTPATARSAVRAALVALDRGRAVLPDQIELAVPDGGVVHVKGGLLTGSTWLSFKAAAGGFPGAANHGCTLVLSAAAGQPVAVLDDGGWLTEMRTAAAGALAVEVLARPDAARVVVLGAGVQARFQIEALRDLPREFDIAVWGRSADRARALARETGAEVAASAPEAVAEADIVVTVTSAGAPVLLGRWLRPGAHVTAVGADTRGKRELDRDVLSRADVLACDDVALSALVGELQHEPALLGRALSLPGIVSGRLPGRDVGSGATAITVADLCGLGVEDAAMADLVMAGVD